MRNILTLIITATLTACSCNSGNTRVGIANPWTDCANLSEAQTIAGRTLRLPEEIAENKQVVYRAMQGNTLELVIGTNDDEIRLRRSTGKADNSGVYDSSNERQMSISGQNVTLRENEDGTTQVIYWFLADETVSISSRKPQPVEQLTELARLVINANK